jgi:hypothetical protein
MSEKILHFLSGAGTALQLFPSSSRTTMPDFMRATDAQKIASDWIRVGRHLQRAIEAETKQERLHGTLEQAKS